MASPGPRQACGRCRRRKVKVSNTDLGFSEGQSQPLSLTGTTSVMACRLVSTAVRQIHLANTRPPRNGVQSRSNGKAIAQGSLSAHHLLALIRLRSLRAWRSPLREGLTRTQLLIVRYPTA